MFMVVTSALNLLNNVLMYGTVFCDLAIYSALNYQIQSNFNQSIVPVPKYFYIDECTQEFSSLRVSKLD